MIWVLMRFMVSLRFDRRGSELIWIYMVPVKVWKSHYFSCTNVEIMQYPLYANCQALKSVFPEESRHRWNVLVDIEIDGGQLR